MTLASTLFVIHIAKNPPQMMTKSREKSKQKILSQHHTATAIADL